MVREEGREHDAVVRQQLAWAFTQAEIMRYSGLRILSEVLAAKEPGPGASINKMFWSEFAQRFAELTLNIRGAKAMVMPEQKPDEYEPDHWQSNFFATRSVTIWGGTAQVQRNIVGERVLGLPKEPIPVSNKGGAQ
jgi:hypothetical protein